MGDIVDEEMANTSIVSRHYHYLFDFVNFLLITSKKPTKR